MMANTLMIQIAVEQVVLTCLKSEVHRLYRLFTGRNLGIYVAKARHYLPLMNTDDTDSNKRGKTMKISVISGDQW
jgi:hypothetical protein